MAGGYWRDFMINPQQLESVLNQQVLVIESLNTI